jgi:hypothetical protein
VRAGVKADSRGCAGPPGCVEPDHGFDGRYLLGDDVQVAALLIAGTSSWAGKSLLATAVWASLGVPGYALSP